MGIITASTVEKEMATHSSILAWEIPWTEEPSGLQSMGSQRVRHYLATKHKQHIKQILIDILIDMKTEIDNRRRLTAQ